MIINVTNVDNLSVEYIENHVLTQGKTHSEVSSLLKEAFTNKRGLSSRSVSRFMMRMGCIYKTVCQVTSLNSARTTSLLGYEYFK